VYIKLSVAQSLVNTTQIFLSTLPKEKRGDLPWQIQDAMESVLDWYNDTDYTVYDNEAVEKFLDTHFDSEVRAAYDNLNPLAYKADLARYCILYIKGGWYLDAGITAIGRMEPNVDLFAFRSMNRYSLTSWACDNGMIYSKAKNPALERAIELVVSNVSNKYYGKTPLCPTGPSLWGRAIAESVSKGNESMMFGDCDELTPNHSIKNKAFIAPGGQILAECKPTHGGDLTGMGAKDTNNYNIFWHRRQVYR